MFQPRRVELRWLQALLSVSALYLLASTAAFGKTYCSSPALPIPDGGTVMDDLLVLDHLVINDVDVSIVASHTWVGDLTFTLEKIAGDGAPLLVTLVERPGIPATALGCSDDDVDLVLNDEAVNGAVEDQCESPLGTNGPYTPDVSLSTFDGVDLNGTWRLTVTDSEVGDTGTLQEWCLIFQSSLDVDGDGEISPLTDGILILRHQFSFSGATLVTDAVDLVNCTRCTAVAIKSYLDHLP